MTTLEAAQTYTRMGIYVVPIPLGQKRPVLKGWPSLRLKEEELPDYFNGKPQNVGALVGIEGLADSDLDSVEAVLIGADHFNEPTGFVFGRESAPASHAFYRTDPPIQSIEFHDPLLKLTKPDDCMILEVRALKQDGGVGLQTVLPPSIHPEGETYQFSPGATKLIQNVDAPPFEDGFRKHAAASLLSRYFPPHGARHDAFLALAGILARAGWSEADAVTFCFAIYKVLWRHTADRSKCIAEVTTTFEKHRAGSPISGIPRLKELIHPVAVDRALEWLGISGMPSATADKGAGPPTPRYDQKGRLLSAISTIGDILLYQHHFARNTGEKLYVYDQGVYRDHGMRLIRERGRELMRSWDAEGQWATRLASEVHEWITLASPELRERPPLDQINLLNGIFDLKTGELRPHQPGWLSPIQLPVNYDPSADCDEWDRFLADWLPPDVFEAGVGYQLIALLMVPYTSAQRALLLRGGRGTGKSRYLAAVRAFLGARNTTSMSLHSLEENRFAAQYLYGKLANICPDLPSDDLESTSTFKAITGEDFINAEYKHGAQFQFQPFARLVFSANQAPTSRDVTDAFLDRWWVVPFERRFQDADGHIAAEELDRRLADPRQLSGVLNRALKLLPQVLRQSGLSQTKSMKEAHDEFCAASDPFRVWLAEFIVDDPDSFEPASEVLSSYFSFRRERGLPSITPTAFGLELRKQKRGLDLKERTIERAGKFSTPRCYIGISLKRKEKG